MKISNKKLQDRRKSVIETKGEISANISSTCRFIGFGMLAIFYTLQTGDSSFALAIRAEQRLLLWAVGFLGVLTVLADYLQYLCAWQSTKATLNSTDYLYVKKSCWYRAWHWFFNAKQFLALGGSIVLCIMIACSVWLSSDATSVPSA